MHSFSYHPRVLPLHDLLAEAASSHSEREALNTPRESWTYARLESAANAMAEALVELGVRRGDRVGILLPKRPEAVAAVYGILKRGGAYVPLDSLAPIPHVAAISSDCGVAAMVTTPSRAAAVLEAIKGKAPRGVVLVDDNAESEVALTVPFVRYAEAAAAAASPPVGTGNGDLACLLYTSGSTGAPKGVMHTHESLLGAARWFCSTMDIQPDDRLHAHAPLHFALALYDLFPAALMSATAVLNLVERPMRGDLVRLAREGEITVWVSTPFPLRALLASAGPADLAALRTVMCGGGSLVGRDVATLRRLAPQARLWQAYGSTEALTVSCHLVQDGPEAERPVAIGDVLQDATALVVSQDDPADTRAEEGELYVRSPRVMRGYWADPKRTAEVLVPHPREGEAGGLFYRTGDIVRRGDGGKLEYVKRIDRTVKIRGYRVDLGEVEAALNDHPAAHESVAMPIAHPQWGMEIVACLELEPGARTTASELRGHVAARLPTYMVPQRLRIMSALPRNSTGKVDHRSLAEELSNDEPNGTV